MRIFIVGCGKIGQTLARELVAEAHDVTVVDTDEQVLANIANTLDVICFTGNGASFLALRDAGVEARIWSSPSRKATRSTCSAA